MRFVLVYSLLVCCSLLQQAYVVAQEQPIDPDKTGGASAIVTDIDKERGSVKVMMQDGTKHELQLPIPGWEPKTREMYDYKGSVYGSGFEVGDKLDCMNKDGKMECEKPRAKAKILLKK